MTLSDCSLVVNNISRRFNCSQVVKDLSFSVNSGEVLGFLGPNGSGKTTTMRIITGFLMPDSGSVTICGYDIVKDSVSAKKHIGYLPEGVPLYGDMTPAMLLKLCSDLLISSKKIAKERYDYVVETLHLENVLHQVIDSLSKGFKRRVGLALAVLHDPDILILDEPTDGLDPLQKFEVRSLIRKIAKDKAIVLSTHIMDEVSQVCDRAMIISHGKLCAEGTTKTLHVMHHDHHVIVASFASSSIDRVVKSIRLIPGIMDVLVHSQDSSGSQTNESVFEIKVTSSSNDAYVAGKVGKCIIDDGSSLLSLTVQQNDLEDVFRNIVLNSGNKQN